MRPCLAAQFGVATAPSVAAVYNWRNDVRGAIIPDEPALAGNARHWMAYSASYDDTTGVATNRTAELFVSLVDNTA